MGRRGVASLLKTVTQMASHSTVLHLNLTEKLTKRTLEPPALPYMFRRFSPVVYSYSCKSILSKQKLAAVRGGQIIQFTF